MGRIIIEYFFDDRVNEKKGNYIKSGRLDSWKIFTLRTVKKYKMFFILQYIGLGDWWPIF